MPIVPDFKDDCGRWVKAYGAGKSITFTRAGKLWYGIRNRCKEGSALRAVSPSYEDVSNEFNDFQFFAEWCQEQVGYGSNYHIDKDLLHKGSRVYSTECCVFLPRELNNFIVLRKSARGEFPLGVTWDKKAGKFVASCQSSGTGFGNFIGYYDTPNAAFFAYRHRKEIIANILAEKWRGLIDHRAYIALKNFTVDIND